MRLFTVCLIFGLAAVGLRPALAQGRVSNFGLKNQNDQYTEVNFPSNRPVILIFGDRKGAGQIGGWSEPLYEKFNGKIYIFGIASLGGVPSYARGLVRRLIKRQTSYPVLLDWGGKVADSVGYEKDKALVILVGKDGSVVSKRTGAASGAEVRSLISEIDNSF